MRLPIIAAIALLAATTAASAQTEAAMYRQAIQDFQHADAHLNTVYTTMTNGLGPHRLLMLRKAQRDWIAFRDAECKFKAARFEGGSLQPLEFVSCETRLTDQRTHTLTTAICKQGDPTC